MAERNRERERVGACVHVGACVCVLYVCAIVSEA